MKHPSSPAGWSECLPSPPSIRANGNGIFDGYASLFGIEDQGRDIVMPGAFRYSLARRAASGVRMLFQHDPAEPIGAWEIIREEARGLYVRGRLIGGVRRAREILALMREGALDGLSIGFRTRKAVRDPRTGQRRLYEIDLWEISIVTFPMLPGARVSAVKSDAAWFPARPHSTLALVPKAPSSPLRGSLGKSPTAPPPRGAKLGRAGLSYQGVAPSN